MILYFSGTGNSRYVAQKIAEISGDDVISINQRLKGHDYSTVSSEKPLVFVGPIYAGRFPRIMDDYIKKVNFTETNRAYFIGTCAQTANGASHRSVLRSKTVAMRSRAVGRSPLLIT